MGGVDSLKALLIAAVLGVVLAGPVTVSAAGPPGGNPGGGNPGGGNPGGGNPGGGNPGGGNPGGGALPINPADTPELGSLILFGGGALGLAGYAVGWRRAHRRPPV
jgi:hypothetical protein